MRKFLGLLLTLICLFSTQTAWSIDYSLHGYYRVFLDWSLDLDTQHASTFAQGNQTGNNRFTHILFAQHRMRLEPTLKINDNLSVHGTVDVLDNVLFGQNDINSISINDPIAGTLQLPGGNGSFGVTGAGAGDIITGGGGSINVRRLYVDILTPVGKFRIGRQASHWGLGIISNDGNGMFDKFGDTFDRFLYIGKVDLNDTSSLALGLITDFAFNAQEDPQLTGLTQRIVGFESGTYQLAGFALYQRPHFEIGTFGGARLRKGTHARISNGAIDDNGATVDGALDGDTSMWFADLYAKFEKGPITAKVEYVHLGGKISTGICINAFQNVSGTNPVPDPLCLDGSNLLNVNMAALEVEGKHDFGGNWKLISGFAQGDSSPLSHNITQFGFRPDYDVGLLLFNIPMGTSPAVQVNGDTKLGNVPITGNRVNNAIYVGATYMHEFDISRAIPQAQYLKVGAHVVTAWAPSRVINLDFGEITGATGAPTFINKSRWYGVEGDLIVEGKFFDHLTWNLTGGLFFPGGAYDIRNDAAASNQIFGVPVNAVIQDTAEMAYAVRSTLFLEF